MLRDGDRDRERFGKGSQETGDCFQAAQRDADDDQIDHAILR
jgi:hypothetical protein